MRRIDVVDETTLPFSPPDVWRVLTDFPAYPSWWPSQVNVVVGQCEPELVGSMFAIRPFGGLGFTCRVSAVVAKSTMRIQYVEGVYRGTGVWTLTPAEQGTRIQYAINLEIVSRLLALLSFVTDLGAIHSRLMQQMFGNLERQVATRLARQ